MGLEYVQIFSDMEALFEPFDDAQRGRLMMAMMAYAYRGEEPQFEGVEKFGWPALKQHIDRCAANVEAKKAAGSKGGRKKTEGKQSEADESKGKQSEADESKAEQNAHNQEQEHEHEYEHDQEKRRNDARARKEATSAAADDGKIVGIDGTDLTEACRDYDRADALVRRFKLPDSDQSRIAIIEDAERVGWEKVEKALGEAALGNSRPMLSVNFYRTKLRGSPGNSGRKDAELMMRYSPEERREAYSAAILDFDEVG